MIRFVSLAILGLCVVLAAAILVLLARRKPAPNSGHWVEPDDASWDDEGLWSRVAGSVR